MTSSTSTRERGRPISPGNGPRRRKGPLVALAAVVVTGGMVVRVVTDEEAPPSAPLTHVVVYEVTGPGGKSPEIRFTAEGVNSSEKVEAVDLPWRRELTIPAGPGLGVAQVMAANGQGESISCTITVDGHVVANNTAKGEFATVSCSNMITPATVAGG
ncbi:MmpS family transport accessory protein [Actinosynnema sp. NPDC059335]|uniref:MmpS family transport accessory protein n=1 Tax=Actinosynnema sp. NPDC059335 TaxID=3346804 RepID=UPI00367000EE